MPAVIGFPTARLFRSHCSQKRRACGADARFRPSAVARSVTRRGGKVLEDVLADSLLATQSLVSVAVGRSSRMFGASLPAFAVAAIRKINNKVLMVAYARYAHWVKRHHWDAYRNNPLPVGVLSS